MMGGGSVICSSQFSPSSSASSTSSKNRSPEEIIKLLKRPKWELPFQGWIKINFSVDMDYDTGIGGIGIVIREEEGNIMEATSVHYVNKTYQYGVVRAAFLGISQALRWQSEKIILEVEGSDEIDLILNKSSVACEEAMRVAVDVRGLLDEHRKDFWVMPIYSSQNEACKWLAHEAKEQKLSKRWMQNLQELPGFLVNKCDEERDNNYM